MANCDMCKHLLTPEGMLHEIGWEHHLTKSGAFAVTVVPESRAKDWAAAKAAMMAAGEKMAKGEATQMCNFCKSMGALFMSGKMETEEFKTIGGEVMLMSSADPATVEAIHKHVKRTIEETKKMEESMKSKTR
jgi:hypothetical protein